LPALTALATAAVPVVTALGGLVAVAGAIGGVGLVGAIGAIATNTEALKGEFSSLLDTIRTEFEPVFSVATGVLQILINDFEDIISTLVPSRSVLQSLGADFVNLGRAVIDVLPALANLAVELADEFLPSFVTLAEDVLPQVPDFIRTLVSVFERLIPSFSRASDILVALGPELLDLGFAALNVVGPALETIGTTVLDAIRGFNELSSNTQQLGIALGTVAPIVAAIAYTLGGPVTLAIAGLTAGIIGLKTAFDNNFAGIRGIVSGFAAQIQRVLPAAREAFGAFVSGVNLGGIIDSLGTFERILREQLRASLVALKPVFGDIKTLLQENQEEFGIIGNAVGGVVRSLIGFAQTILKVLGPAFRKVGIPIIRGFITLLDGAISNVANLIQLFGALRNQEFGRVQDIGGRILEEGAQTYGELLPSQQTIQGAAQQAQQTVEVIVEEDTDIVDTRINDTVDRRNRQTNRESYLLGDRTP
jgi:hypothetical protein